MKGEKGIGGTVTTGDGLSEELTEEAFSKFYSLVVFIIIMSFLKIMLPLGMTVLNQGKDSGLTTCVVPVIH